jgi:LPS-assembly protein
MDWNLRRTTVGGLVYRLFANLRGDLYSVENVKDPSNPAVTFSDTTLFRGLPTMGTEVSYPLVRNSGGLREVLEPILQLIYSPDIGNTVELPNEDSLSFEFDDTNLFSENRFPGLDRWETGTRLNAGMRYSLFWGPQGRASALIGQSFRLNENQSFSSASGLRNELSDVVGRIMVSPSSNWLIVHRFRVGSESFKLRRNEVNAYGRYGPVSAQLGYAYFAADQFSTFTPREEIVLGSVVRLDDYWRLFGQTRRDLSKHRAVNNSVGVGYSDECLDISLGYYQSFTRDRDIEPENSFILRLTLKTLGSTDG